ncbi:MAG: threonine--tRNA ligase, partial [Burkholderiaceae bacterium]
VWDKAENALIESLRRCDVAFDIAQGDGAFYGPKIEYTLKDAIGRQWQCGTIQVDFSMAQRLEAEYVDEDGSRKPPVMLHRAILGSLERFIGILIEQLAGALPVWLAPQQVAVLNITDNQGEAVQSVVKTLRDQGFRAVADTRNEKINAKIRHWALQKVPYLAVIGEKEREAGTVALRARGNQDLGTHSIAAFTQMLQHAVTNRL